MVTTGGNSSAQQNSLSQLIQFRTQRTSNRQRRCAYLNLNGRNSNPPAILQRLLGPTVAQNVNIGLGQVIANANGSASFRDATRVVVMDNGFGIFSNSGEPSIDLVDQAGYLFGRSLAATLNNTPSPLHWWLEEAKILGLESQADVCLTVCNDLIPELEVQRSLEMSKTRGKRKKKTAADGSGAPAQANKQKNRTSDENVPETPATVVSRTNATISNTEVAERQDNFSTEATERDDAEDETDDSEQADEDDEEEEDDDDSSKNDEDEQVDDNNEEENEEDEAIPHLLPYAESNEEMTESDCNAHEGEPIQNEDEDNGGSASDNSVVSEAFYQVAPDQHRQERCSGNATFPPADNIEG